jgi:hypothetical protein
MPKYCISTNTNNNLLIEAISRDEVNIKVKQGSALTEITINKTQFEFITGMIVRQLEAMKPEPHEHD